MCVPSLFNVTQLGLLRGSFQSSLLVIDTIIQSGVISNSGRGLQDSLSQLDTTYAPVSPPAFIPADFGEASRIQHQINVALTAMCNCTFLDLVL
jgi:hypothetical protein